MYKEWLDKAKQLFLRKENLLVLLLVAVMGTGVTYAFLQWKSQELINQFNVPIAATLQIDEEFNQQEKKNLSVRVADTGYSMYVRAAIVVNWVNANGEIYSSAPREGLDYSITLDLANGWSRASDGFYYYQDAVASGQRTGVLITSCTRLLAPPETGYFLKVEIVAQTIQAAGTTDVGGVTARFDAWGK
jgi:hypothetical protein